MKELKAQVGKIGTRMKLYGVGWSVAAGLFVDDMVELAESERELQRIVGRVKVESNS